MTSLARRRASRDAPSTGFPRLSSDGVFANGVTAATVTQFVLDHDESARIEDVAAYFDLQVEDVAAALRCYALHGERMRDAGVVVPKR